MTRHKVEDDHESGRPFTSRADEKVERVRQKVRSDRRRTVRMIADELDMNSEGVWRIITEDLGMRIYGKMAPMLLNEGQKERRVRLCQDILEQLLNGRAHSHQESKRRGCSGPKPR